MGIGSKRVFLFGGALALLIGGAASPLGSEPSPGKSGLRPPLVAQACAYDLSPPLRDMRFDSRSAQEMEAAEGAMPKRIIPGAAKAAERRVWVEDPVVQRWPGRETMPQPLTSWEGIAGADNYLAFGRYVRPPDTNGDVGPNHYVQWVNLLLAVWDKSGNLLLGPIPGNALWAGFGGPADQCNNGDPIVLYDRLADRWLISQFALCSSNYAGPFYQYIAISATPDPMGRWHRYAFQWPGGKFNDYPKFGVWPDGYYMSSTQWTNVIDYPGNWAGEGVAVFERAKMLTGDPTATFQYFDLDPIDPDFGGMLPAHATGAAPPPIGAPNPFIALNHRIMESDESGLALWEFHTDWDNPGQSSFGFSGQPNQVLGVAPYDITLCDFDFNCIRQPGTANRLDAIQDRVMYRLVYRNFGDHQSLVVNHTVDADGTDHAAIRWYELRSTGDGWGVHQEGTFAPDADSRWMGSVAMDKDGNIAVGYSVSGSATHPSLRYAGRLAGDPAGELAQGEASLIAGSGVVTSGVRWGDYSSMSVDPSDDRTFWFTGEYQAVDSPYGDWRTRIGSFRFYPGDLIVSAQATPASGAIPLSVQFAAQGTGGSAPYVFEWDFGDGASATGEAVSHTYAAAGSFTASVTLTDDVASSASATTHIRAVQDLPSISRVTKLPSPFRLKVLGVNFHSDCTIKVNGVPVPQTIYKRATKLKASGGAALKALLPKGQAVQITVVNNDDGGVSATYTFTR